jgi:arginine deiminase
MEGEIEGPAVGRVDSEVGRLRRVVITPPGHEFERMLPSNIERHALDGQGQLGPNPSDLLFDDLVHLPALRAQHDVLGSILRAVVGTDGVLSTRTLLAETVQIPEGRSEAIEATCRFERDVWEQPPGLVAEIARDLASLPASDLAETLISGASPDGRQWLRWPLPNLLFARDLGAVLGDAIVLTYAAKPARLRGMALARAIFRHHPSFAGASLIDIRDGGLSPDGACLEGGDLQVIDAKTVLVGASERTTPEGIERLSTRLFEHGFERILTLEMPARRGTMHLDTLFTRIDRGHVLLYPPMVLDPESMGLRVSARTVSGETDLGADLVAALSDLGVEVSPVFCGGDDPTSQRREQWSDGANAFALEPGVFLTYRRNQATLDALERAGFPPLSAEAFLADPGAVLGTGQKAAIHIDGHELVRGRGGPRCLTMPLARVD